MKNYFLAKVSEFRGSNENPAQPDINGKMPVILDVLAGNCPRLRVISGTVAERGNLEVGNSYLFKWEEREANDYGRQFNFTAVDQVTGMDIITISEKLGTAKIFEVDATAEQEEKEAIKQAEGHQD